MHLPTPIAIYLSTRTSERNAARLFFILKTLDCNKCVFTRKEVCEAAAEFSRYEVEKYLKTLTKMYWVGLDSKGRYYLRSYSFLIKLHGNCRSCLSVMMPSDALSSKKAWTDFVFSAALTSAGRKVQHWTNRRISDNTSLVRTIPAGISTGRMVEVALSIVSLYTGMSKAAAYRARKRAGTSHLRVETSSERSYDMNGKICQPTSRLSLMPCSRIRARKAG